MEFRGEVNMVNGARIIQLVEGTQRTLSVRLVHDEAKHNIIMITINGCIVISPFHFFFVQSVLTVRQQYYPFVKFLSTERRDIYHINFNRRNAKLTD